MARPFTNKVEKSCSNCTDHMVGGARSIALYDACTPSSGYRVRLVLLPKNDKKNFFSELIFFSRQTQLEVLVATLQE